MSTKVCVTFHQTMSILSDEKNGCNFCDRWTEGQSLP